MKFSELMKYYDYKKTNVSRALNVCRETVTKWQKHDAIPWHKQCEAQVLTEGALMASKNDCPDYEKKRFFKCQL